MDAAGRQCLASRDHFATGRQHGHARTPCDRDLVLSDARQQHQLRGVEYGARRQQRVAFLHVLAAAADMRPRRRVIPQADTRIRQPLDAFERQHGGRPRRQCRTGHDLPGMRVVLRRNVARRDPRRQRPAAAGACCRSVAGQRHPVHRGVVECRQRHRTNDVAGQDAPGRMAQRDALFAAPLGALQQPCHRLVITDHCPSLL